MKIETLYKNGATLLYRKAKRRFVSVAISFVFGSNRDNYPNSTAHFCEHMFFESTNNLDKEAFRIQKDEVFGRRLNGQTGVLMTSMTFLRSKKIIEQCFDLASQMMLECKYDPETIESEKGVIQEELVRALNSPRRKEYKAIARTWLNKYVDGENCVLGTKEEIDAVNAELLEKFRKENFISQNLIVEIRGGISYSKAKKLAEKYFINKVASNPDYPVDHNVVSLPEKDGNLHIEEGLTDKTKCVIRIILNEDLNTIPNMQRANLVVSLCNGIGGKLRCALRDKGLVYAVSMSAEFTEGKIAYLIIEFPCSANKVNDTIDEIGKVLYDLRNNPIDDNVVQTRKQNLRYGSDEIQKVISPLTMTQHYLRYGIRHFTKKQRKQLRKSFDNMTNADIQEFCKKAFTKEQTYYITLITKEDAKTFYDYDKIIDILTNDNI